MTRKSQLWISAIIIAMVAAFLVSYGCSALSDNCTSGDMRCQGTMAQMFGQYGWADFQNCGSVGQTCSTDPGQCGGYNKIACCK